MNRSRGLLLVIATALAGCGSSSQSAPPRPDGPGRAQGPAADATVVIAADGPAPLGDAPASRDASPPSPGPASCRMPDLCASLITRYEQAVRAAQSCTIGQDGACRVKAPRTLRCPGCDTWVNDRTALDALRAQFRDAGCEGCPSRGLAADGSCPTGPCARTLTSPTCAPLAGIAAGGTAAAAGSCDDQSHACGPGVMEGAPCAPIDSCAGGGQVACVCFGATNRWQCR